MKVTLAFVVLAACIIVSCLNDGAEGSRVNSNFQAGVNINLKKSTGVCQVPHRISNVWSKMEHFQKEGVFKFQEADYNINNVMKNCVNWFVDTMANAREGVAATLANMCRGIVGGYMSGGRMVAKPASFIMNTVFSCNK